MLWSSEVKGHINNIVRIFVQCSKKTIEKNFTAGHACKATVTSILSYEEHNFIWLLCQCFYSLEKEVISHSVATEWVCCSASRRQSKCGLACNWKAWMTMLLIDFQWADNLHPELWVCLLVLLLTAKTEKSNFFQITKLRFHWGCTWNQRHISASQLHAIHGRTTDFKIQ